MSNNSRGSAIEYVLIIALIAVAIAAVIPMFTRKDAPPNRAAPAASAPK